MNKIRSHPRMFFLSPILKKPSFNRFFIKTDSCFDNFQDILGLDQTTKNALEFIMKQLSKYYSETVDFYADIKVRFGNWIFINCTESL